MNFSELRQVLETEMSTQWIHSPVVWENAPSDITDVPWVRFSVRPASGETGSLGSKMNINKGFLAIQVFIPLNSGTGKLYEFLDHISDIFENKRYSEVFLYGVSVETIGDGVRQIDKIEAGFHQAIATISFDAIRRRA
jgi:hypothetical protein